MTSPCGGLNHKFCPKSKIVWKVWNIHRSDQFLMLIPNISFVLTKNVYFDLLWRIMVLYIVKWQVPGIMLPTETVEIRGFAWALLFNGHFKLYTNVKIHENLRKVFDLRASFSKIPITLISENPLKLMFGTKNMRNHRGYLLVKIAARYLIFFSSYLKNSHTHEFFGRPLLSCQKKIYFGFSEI